MRTVEQKPEKCPWDIRAEAIWAVRVLLAAAASRALRAGLSKEDICELLRELEDQGEPDA
jgi:hypothetical protein